MRAHGIIVKNCLNIFPEILKKCLNVPKIFQNISNPRNITYFCFKNRPISNPLGQHFPQRELKSMSYIVNTYNGNKTTFKTKWLQSVKWETAELDYF